MGDTPARVLQLAGLSSRVALSLFFLKLFLRIWFVDVCVGSDAIVVN